jgi:hypothetical protein
MANEANRGDSASLNFKDALDLTMKAGTNVDSHWRQFYTFVFALLAWLSSSLSNIGEAEAIIISVATAGFFTINAVATVRAYILLNLLLAETTAAASNATFSSAYVRKRAATKYFVQLPMRIPLTVLANMVAAGAIIRLVWKSAT